MRIGRATVGTVLCAALAAVAGAGEGGKKTIELTTSSAEARKQAQEAVRRIESFQFAPRIQEPAKKAVEADPEFAFARYLVAVSSPGAQARPHHEKALELVKKASSGEQRYLEAVALNRGQKAAEALAAFEKLATDYPDDRMVQMMIGQISLNTGKLEEARAAFEKAIAWDPSTPRAHALLGNVHLLRGDYARAREIYQAALARKAPGTAPGQIHYGIAFTHLYEGKAEAALKILEGFLEEYRKSGRALEPGGNPEVFIWNSIARVHLENGRPEEALKAYEKGFESVPGSLLDESQKQTWRGRLHHGKARTLARLGRHEDAWKEAETVKKMIDEGGEEGKQFLPAYHYVAGYLKLEAKDYAAAIEHLKQSDPEDPFHKLLLARAYEKAGDKASARKAYQEIVEFRVNNLERALAYPGQAEARRSLA